jgi:hypothetical protein
MMAALVEHWRYGAQQQPWDRRRRRNQPYAAAITHVRFHFGSSYGNTVNCR